MKTLQQGRTVRRAVVYDYFVVLLQFIADHVETNALFQEEKECQALIMEALKYHLLPERRSSFQSPRTKPRKSTVGIMYAVGGIDCNKGKLTQKSPCNRYTCLCF